MKYKKKFVLAMLTLLLLAKTSDIYAKNNSDTDWSVGTFGSVGYTPVRIKTDPSPVYFYDRIILKIFPFLILLNF